MTKWFDHTKWAEFYRNAFLINPYFIFLQKSPTYIICFILIPPSDIPRLKTYFATLKQHRYIAHYTLDPIQTNTYITNYTPTKKQLASMEWDYHTIHYAVDVSNNQNIEQTTEFMNYADMVILTTIRKISQSLDTYHHGQYQSVFVALYESLTKNKSQLKELLAPIRLQKSIPRILTALWEEIQESKIFYTKQLLLAYNQTPLSKDQEEKYAMLLILERLGYYNLQILNPQAIEQITQEIQGLKTAINTSMKRSELESHFYRMLYLKALRSNIIQNLETSLISYHPFMKLRLISTQPLELLKKLGILVNEARFDQDIWTTIYLKNDDVSFIIPYLYRWYEEQILIADIPSTSGDNIQALMGLFDAGTNRWNPAKMGFETDLLPFAQSSTKAHYGVTAENNDLLLKKREFPPLPPLTESEFWTQYELWSEMGKDQINITSTNHGKWVEVISSLLVCNRITH